MEVVTNQLLSRQSLLNYHRAHWVEDVTEECPKCGQKETIEHFIFDCNGYKDPRDEMEKEVELLLHLNGKDAEKITMKVLTGNMDNEQILNNQVIQCFHTFIKSTERFS